MRHGSQSKDHSRSCINLFDPTRNFGLGFVEQCCAARLWAVKLECGLIGGFKELRRGRYAIRVNRQRNVATRDNSQNSTAHVAHGRSQNG